MAHVPPLIRTDGTLASAFVNPVKTVSIRVSALAGWRVGSPSSPSQEVVPVDESPDNPSEAPDEREQLRALEEEILSLRRRLQDAPKRVRTLEERLLETKGQLSQAVNQNEKLTYTLREAREHIAALRDEVDKLTRPPSAYGTFLTKNDDGTVDVF